MCVYVVECVVEANPNSIWDKAKLNNDRMHISISTYGLQQVAEIR